MALFNRDGAMAMEVELKLRLAPDALEALLRHPLLRTLRQGPSRRQRLVSVYFDTPDHGFAADGLTLRVRHVGRARVQTVKADLADGTGDSLQRRIEWSSEIVGDGPEITRVGDRALRERLASHSGETGVREVFRSDVRRRTWPLVADGARIELALDRGEIAAGETREQVCEAELELISGDARALFDLALGLAGEVPFALEHRTKAERGYALARGTSPAPAAAPKLKLPPKIRLWDGFVTCARSCLGHLQANETAVLSGDDPESIHQLRVAVRRLRALFALFSRALPAQPAGALDQELRWLQGETGAARDWDVLIHDVTGPVRAELPGEPALEALAAAAAAARERSRGVARDALRSPRFALFQLGLEHWLASGGADEDARLGKYAAKALSRRDDKLRGAGEALSALDPVALHRVRIRVKKLRYAGELFRSLFDRKAAKTYLSRLRLLQDSLGALNDASVAARLVGGLGVPGVGPIIEGWIAARAAASRASLDEMWAAWRDEARFWE
ncbi:MAG: CHAD domain-containing protein [Alphaproteobacteria bacterium]